MGSRGRFIRRGVIWRRGGVLLGRGEVRMRRE